MGFLASVGSIAGSALSNVADKAVGYFFDKKLVDKDIDFQKETNATIQAREDNAVQRRVADLVAAGLSPTLAAGSAAQTADYTSPSGYKNISPFSNSGLIGGMLDMIGSIKSIEQAQANIDKTNSEKANIDVDTTLKTIESTYKPDLMSNDVFSRELGNKKLGVENSFLDEYLKNRNLSQVIDISLNRAKKENTSADTKNKELEFKFNRENFYNKILAEKIRTDLLNNELFQSDIDSSIYSTTGVNPKYNYGMFNNGKILGAGLDVFLNAERTVKDMLKNGYKRRYPLNSK